MKKLTAFVKKELMEQWRTGRMLILGIVFLIFGILNPAAAKLTPALLQLMSEEMEAAGLQIGEITVTALTSWEQFYKNAPMVLIVLVIMLSGTFASEYQKGTLINMLTKGLARSKVYAAKAISMVLVWTGCYLIYYLVTLFYTVYFWDNSIAKHPVFAATFIYLFGLFLIALILFFSALASTGTGVLGGVGAVVIVLYLLGIVPKVAKYLPTDLLNAGSIVNGSVKLAEFGISAGITCAACVVLTVLGEVLFEKKAL